MMWGDTVPVLSQHAKWSAAKTLRKSHWSGFTAAQTLTMKRKLQYELGIVLCSVWKPDEIHIFTTIDSSGTCSLTPNILLSLSQNTSYLEAPAILDNKKYTRALGNHTQKHIRSTAPTDNARKSYIDFTIVLSFWRTRYHLKMILWCD